MAFGTGKSEMNVTPLIDVLLVRIIIFMVIVPVTPAGLETSIPHDAVKSDLVPIRTVVIQLHANGVDRPTLTMNEEPVRWEHLSSRLIEIYKQRAERVAFVRADRDLDFEPVADVIDVAHAAGVENIGLMK